MAGFKAVFFDQDGVIIDTERDGHRVAFNRTFQEFGIAVSWDVETYRELLAVAGGKERMAHYLRTRGFGKPVPAGDEEPLIRRLHERKTEIFVELIESGSLPLRPGVRRLMGEIASAGLALGICTTSNERAARAMTEKILPEFHFEVVLAGDVVKKKKPDPEIYLLALARMNLAADQCIVIEDSANGVEAAARAGIRAVATSNAYTEQEDLSKAGIVVTSLGDPGGERGRLKKPDHLAGYEGVLRLQQISDYFTRPG